MLFYFIEKLAWELGYNPPFFKPMHTFKVSVCGIKSYDREKKANKTAKGLLISFNCQNNYLNFLCLKTTCNKKFI